MIRRRVTAAVLVAVLAFGAVGAAGCGSSSSSSSGTPTVHFAKTKFLLHAGLAFGAFHRYVYKPYKARGFTPPLKHKAAIVKASLAAAFAYHETKIALTDARASKVLRTLIGPILAVQTGLRSLATRMKGGNLDASGIQSTNGAIDSLSAQSKSAGAAITDHAPPPIR